MTSEQLVILAMLCGMNPGTHQTQHHGLGHPPVDGTDVEVAD
jgi:hypothetical protein